MKHKKGSGLIFLGLAMIVAALCLTFWNMLDENRAHSSTDEIMAQLREQVPDYHSAAPSLPAQMQDSDSAAVPLPGEVEIPNYRLDPHREMPVEIVNGKPYIGVLTVPALGLELPVIQQWSYPNLRVAPCRYTGSLAGGDMVIMGHNYRSHFTPLHRVLPGAAVEFEDVNGVVHHYTVDRIDYIHKSEAELLPSEHPLILFTCTAGGQNRIVIRCS